MLTGNQQFSSLGGTVLTKVLPVKKNAFFLVTSKYTTFWLPQHTESSELQAKVYKPSPQVSKLVT